MTALPRVQRIVAPILRGDPRLSGVTVVTWVPDVDYRQYPMLQIRRIGGTRNINAPKKFALPVIELTAYSDKGLVECEELYETALEVLYDAVDEQTMTSAGYLQSILETMGDTQFGSLFQDSWRSQGLIRLGIRSR